MPVSDHTTRAQLVMLEVNRLVAEGRRCSDRERIRAIAAELDVLSTSLYEIRREQLLAELEREQAPAPRRRWWQLRRQRNSTAASGDPS